jgi:hypothetical protein
VHHSIEEVERGGRIEELRGGKWKEWKRGKKRWKRGEELEVEELKRWKVKRGGRRWKLKRWKN